jgi:glutamate--tRNA ligase
LNIKKNLNISYQKNDVLKTFGTFLKNKEFTIDNIQLAINETKQKLNIKGKELFMPIRIALTYEEHGPELAKAIYLFGQDIIYERLSK